MSAENDNWERNLTALRFPGNIARHKYVHGPFLAAIVLSLIFIVTVALPDGLPTVPASGYLPLHTLLEFISVLVSLMIFTLTWSLRWQGANGRRMLIGAGFLAVGLIDMMHLLSYEGMPAIFSPNTPDKAIFFWLVARYVTALTLLLIPLVRDVRLGGLACYGILGGTILFCAGIWVVGTFHADLLPATFIEGQGLTPFKILAEYGVVVVLTVAAGALGVTGYRHANRRRLWVAASAWCLLLSEIYFTLYADVIDMANIYGHIFKAVAFAMLFRASFVSGVVMPYRQLDLERSWLEALLTSLPDPIWLKAPDGVFLSCNKAFERLAGSPKAEIVGRTDYDFFDKAQADLYRRNDQLALKGGAVNVNEELIDTANRRQRLFETSKAAVYLADGSLLGVLGIAHDITDQRAVAERLQKLARDLEQENAERRQAEAKLVAANAMYDAVIRGMPVALMVVDPEGAIITWNEAARRTFGHDEADILGQSGHGVFAEPSRSVYDAAFRDAVASRSRPAMEVNCLRKSGTPFPAILHQASVRAGDGAVRAIVFAIEDVSERRSIEAQLRQSQKMEAVGQLTAGIAHDFNNILAIIVGNLELLLEDCGEGPSEALGRSALNASLRGAALTQRLLAYSRQQTLEPTVVNVAHLLRGDALLMRRSLEESIAIEMCLPDSLWSVRVDVARLQDSLLNLALNARDSMPQGGTLTIAAENVELDEDYASRNLEVTAGEYVKLSICDTGSGMTPDILEQVLEPFFTTKPMGEGSGLGLSMVFGFVKQSGGHMEIDSAPGAGTRINLYLPRATEDAATAAAANEKEHGLPAHGAGEAILLIEDDADVREMIVMYLKKLGYRVTATSDGQEALNVLKSGRPVDMIVTDVVLPGGMRGPDIVAAAEDITPGLKSLYISGYSQNALSLEGELMKGVHLLSKPFRMTELAQRMRDILDA